MLTEEKEQDRRRRRKVAAFLIVFALVVGGAVMAAWLISGSGTGRVGVQVSQGLTIDETSPAQSLYPGANVALTATIHNPNAFPVFVPELTLGTPTSSDEAACPAANVTVAHAAFSDDTTASASGGSGWQIPANGTRSVALAGAVTMSSSPDAGCQGDIVFTVPLTAVGAVSGNGPA